MPNNTSLQLLVRRGQRRGDKLVLRHAAYTQAVARQLMRASGITDLPGQITVGYFFQRDGDGAWAFSPSPMPLAVAALEVEAVQLRICQDLAIRERERQREAE